MRRTLTVAHPEIAVGRHSTIVPDWVQNVWADILRGMGFGLHPKFNPKPTVPKIIAKDTGGFHVHFNSESLWFNNPAAEWQAKVHAYKNTANTLRVQKRTLREEWEERCRHLGQDDLYELFRDWANAHAVSALEQRTENTRHMTLSTHGPGVCNRRATPTPPARRGRQSRIATRGARRRP